MSHAPAPGRSIHVRGIVQGVGYRPWVFRLARELGLSGHVKNDAVGVVIEAYGPTAALDAFIRRLAAGGPPASDIASLVWHPIDERHAPPPAFDIEASDTTGERRVSVPPDLATCDACLEELGNPFDRRYRYPFINCTACGPRYTIVRGVPYDRPATSMAGFTMCPACQAEYDSPEDRRFHAQPNACPACGPRLVALSAATGEPLGGDPVEQAVGCLRHGGIVAVKGLGGYHLACDAADDKAVARLRARKHREAKPLAVMVADLEAARRLALLSPEEALHLSSPQRPILLVRRRPGAAVAGGVSETPLCGLMLAYTPLHHLLLRDFGGALVMTSGNLSEQPILFRDDEALAGLAGVADLFLTHDRPIEARCDDSIARVIGGRAVPLRRARGWVPAPVLAPRRVAHPVLAAGGDLKNAFCLAVGDAAYLGPHVGDLEHMSNLEALTEGVERLERLLGVRPQVIAHDLHPGYASTAWALSRPEPLRVAVQHHHAHVAAAMADAGLDRTVLGLAWDGTGCGTDGTAWGGELLLADYAGYERLGSFRPLALPGGDVAVREPWRIALAALDDAFEGPAPAAIERLPLFRGRSEAELEVVRRMAAARLNTPMARGVGRYFDLFAAIGLGLPAAAYEGQLAARWELAADPGERRAYPFTLDERADPWLVDLRPALREATLALCAGRSPAEVSARFHNTLVAAGEALVRLALARFGAHPVVLTGGCFQNARLSEGLCAALAPAAVVHTHRRVPPGDGGLALGQALIADAWTRDSNANTGSEPCA